MQSFWRGVFGMGGRMPKPFPDISCQGEGSVVYCSVRAAATASLLESTTPEVVGNFAKLAVPMLVVKRSTGELLSYREVQAPGYWEIAMVDGTLWTFVAQTAVRAERYQASKIVKQVWMKMIQYHRQD